VGGADVLVRINRPWRMAIRDVEAVISSRIHALMLPKVPNAQHVQALSEIVSELEAERGMAVGATKFVVLIETAQAYPRIEEIVHADPRIIAISLGSEDFSATCGMVPDDDGLYVPKMQLLIFARAAGIVPLGFVGTVADYQDLDGLRAGAQRARRLGYMGAACVHPAQVPVINEAYGPTAEELEHARRVLEAANRAETGGVGAYVVDGKMIDFPVVERARRIVARHDAIEQRQRAASK
jgi:citrate lyase subunit beta/citryl-CoA lyase